MVGQIALVILLLGSVHCALYVDVAATCGTSCDGSSAAPFPTLLGGLNAIPHGGFLIVNDGVYKGVGNKNLNISSQDTSIVSVNGPGATIIDCENDGYGFDLFSGSFTITGLTIRNCFRDAEATYEDHSYGGGAFSIHSTFTSLNNMVLENNDAKGLGGAVYIYSNAVVFTNTTITRNNVTGVGGGVYVESADLQLNNATITGNKASINASDLFCIRASVELNDQTSQISDMVCPICPVTRNHVLICKQSSNSVRGATWSVMLVIFVSLYVLLL
eukprot:Phypoly_transcript_15683.p1 GENE.Phypoly_transcript_15683~~Phypoly_transcript_15683.p1  ORF type:complete len:274 (+),score=28.82 Phypoly_transcript_15683:85-906(+)